MTEAEARLKMYNAQPKTRPLYTAVTPKAVKQKPASESSVKKIAITVIGGIAAAYSVKYLKKMGVL